MTTKTKAPPMAEDHTARLAELRQVEAQERHAQRDAEMALPRAEAALVTAYDELVAATADGNRKGTRSADDRHAKAQQAVADTQLAADAAKQRAERAANTRALYEQSHADDLLRELQPEADQIAQRLADHRRGLIEEHERWQAMAGTVNALLRAASAMPAHDGPPEKHGLEGAVAEAKRAPGDPPAPTPRWLGRAYREQEDKTNRFERLRRKKKLTDTEQHELQRLGQDRVASPSVAMFSNDDAA